MVGAPRNSPDVILDRIPEGVDYRPHMGLAVKLAAVLYRLGFDVGAAVEWHHTPALINRPWNATTGDTVPPANDPRYIVPLAPEAHKVCTHGPGGEKRITTAGSDRHQRDKRERLAEGQAEMRRRMLAKDSAEPPAPAKRSRWASRPMRRAQEAKPSKARTPNKLRNLPRPELRS